ncbi:MAG: DUF4835 family protein [Cyclobacteriaceae bacterium]|nr:DUF4835 family protein [Cyclobacteriaceae bacterium HetDA_MAG_MS6]
MMISVAGKSQELNCRVIINSERIQITERSIFDEMQQAFTDFLNNQKWTENEFQDKERINCNLIINLDPEQSDPASGRYGASVQILSSRPVYGSDYESVLLNFADRDWVFEYLPSQPMQFNPNSFLNNITSLLAYYAYVILAFDYDSFSDLGGDPYVQKAWQVVNNAQQSGYSGWEQFNSIRNRYWLAENLLNAQMQPIRKAYYEYHRTGLDLFQEKPDEARTSIFESIKKVQNANASRPRAILTISFLDAKASELAQIFSDGNPSQRRNAYNMLTNIDPTKNDVLKPMIE